MEDEAEAEDEEADEEAAEGEVEGAGKMEVLKSLFRNKRMASSRSRTDKT